MNPFSFGNFDKILASLEETLEVYPRRCINLVKSSSCQKCLDLCPNGILSQKSLRMTKKCGKCGLCATVCPTEVFELKKNSDQLVLSRIKLFLEHTPALTFVCDKNTNFSEKSVIKVPCLGRLNESLLVGAAALGATFIWLDESFCSECEIKKGNLIAQKVVGASREILKSFSSPTEIFVSAEPPEQIKKQLFRDLPEEQYSRRNLFGYLRKTAIQTGMAVIESNIPSILIADKKKKVQNYYQLPAKRALLLNFISQFGRPLKREILAENVPFNQVEIKDNCTLCGKCVKFCPTKALVYARNNVKAGSIDFALPLCTACELCQKVCPEEALTFRDYIYAPLLGMYKRRRRHQKKRLVRYSLINYQFYQCKDCQKQFGSIRPSELCPSCQSNSQLNPGAKRMPNSNH